MLSQKIRVGIQFRGAKFVSVVSTYQVLFIVWVILVIVAIILLCVFAEDVGMKDVLWVPIIGGVIAIIFGVILLLCCREGANRLSWRKRMLLYSVLNKVEEKDLKDTELGIRAGKEGAWIELGNKATLGSRHSYKTFSNPRHTRSYSRRKSTPTKHPPQGLRPDRTSRQPPLRLDLLDKTSRQ